MEQWQEEKAALLATIKRQERHAAVLAKRFKLLQRTLAEQQRTLDRYQRALQQSDARAAKRLALATEASPPSQHTRKTRSASSASLLESRASTSSTATSSRNDASTPAGQNGNAEKTARCVSPPARTLEESEAPPSPDLLVGAERIAGSDRGDDYTDVQAPNAVQTQRARVEKNAAAPLETPSSFVRDETRGEKGSTRSSEQKCSLSDAWVKRKVVLSSNTKPTPVFAEPAASRSASTNATSTGSTTAVSPPAVTAGKGELKRPLPLPPTKCSIMAPTWAEEKRRIQQGKKVKSSQVVANPVHSSARTYSGDNKNSHHNGRSEVKFAYVEVVRNREERAALPAHDCAECRQYYEALGELVSAEDVAAHKNRCSRHRARYEPYQTPDDFWRLSFPDSGGHSEPQTP